MTDINKPSQSPSQAPSVGKPARRKLLKGLGGASAVVAASQMPDKWMAPMVDLVVLPAHSKTSDGRKPATICTEGHVKGNDKLGCCEDANKSDPAYLDDCCISPALDSNGNLVKDSQGRYLCCDLLAKDKTSPEYLAYCCDHRGANPDGSLAKDSSGKPICCDKLDQNSSDYKNFCCQNKATNPDGTTVVDGSGDAVCCEGSSVNPDTCCIRTTVVNSVSVPSSNTLKPTAWTTDPAGAFTSVNMADIPQWRPTDGPLAKVEIVVDGEIESNGWIESFDTSSQPVTFIAQAELSVVAPGGISFVIAPTANEEANPDLAPGNVLDRKGDDFWQINSLSASKRDSIEITDPTTLQHYIGSGNLPLHVTAQGTSKFVGPANVDNHIETAARAVVTVTYYCTASR